MENTSRTQFWPKVLQDGAQCVIECVETAQKVGAEAAAVELKTFKYGMLEKCAVLASELMTRYDVVLHYDADTRDIAPEPSPICPKCGSHRTEVIGLSDDLKLKFIRCNACGFRSAVPNASAEPSF